jgi:hypothetical protein
MIGWWIVIAAQTPEDRDAGINREAAILTNWETSIGGHRWVQKLVDEGNATQRLTGGYPNRYTARPGDVLPVLAQGIPDHDDFPVIGDDYVMPAGWKGNVVWHADKIAACPSDQVLTIEVWDQS